MFLIPSRNIFDFCSLFATWVMLRKEFALINVLQLDSFELTI